jgi:DNA-binding NtrC family response regulator
MNYRFPGNIRQLKNIAEQISILEMDREISASVLASYLPKSSSSMLPAILGEAAAEPGMSERDLLYKIFFDLRRDVTELKQFVVEMVARGGISSEAVASHPNLFPASVGIKPVPAGADGFGVKTDAVPAFVPASEEITEEDDSDYQKILDISHETEEESLCLQHQEREMILKALKKNHNRRKNAARDLGISERTLYRKIKLFGIEE